MKKIDADTIEARVERNFGSLWASGTWTVMLVRAVVESIVDTINEAVEEGEEHGNPRTTRGLQSALRDMHSENGRLKKKIRSLESDIEDREADIKGLESALASAREARQLQLVRLAKLHRQMNDLLEGKR